jgi:hypothetical protein
MHMIMRFPCPGGGWVIVGPRLHPRYVEGTPVRGSAPRFYPGNCFAPPDETGPSAQFIDPGSESLRGNAALHREFAEIELTEKGVVGFFENHPDLGTEPGAHFVPNVYMGKHVCGECCAPISAKIAPTEAACNVLALRRATRLWDMVRRNDQARLRHHISLATPEDYAPRRRDSGPPEVFEVSISPPDDPAQSPAFIYDSHPDLPAGKQPPPPELRERSYIVGLGAEVGPVGKGKEIDRRPAARAYVISLINAMLAGGLSAHVVEGPGKQGRRELQLVPRSALAAIWLQFAQEVTGDFIPAKCPVCGEWFRPVKHRDRMYCKGKCDVKAHRIRKMASKLKDEGMSLNASIKVTAEKFKVDVAVVLQLVSAQRKEDRRDT